MSFELHHGDAFEVLRGMKPNSFHSCVTDPPYGIRFMGKAWDGEDIVAKTTARRRQAQNPNGRSGPSGEHNSIAAEAGKFDRRTSANVAYQKWCRDWAREVYRVLKPGAYLVAFCSPRTYHRLAAGIEDAGFEVRDQLLYAMQADEHVHRFMASLNEYQRSAFLRCIEESQFGGQLAWVFGSGFPKSLNLEGDWAGWGTALKPAWEPIVLARKPLSGTVEANVAKHGVGALNIDACRIAVADDAYARNHTGDRGHGQTRGKDGERTTNFRSGGGSASDKGRWPANLAHDGSAEVVAHFPAEAGAAAPVHRRNGDKFRNTYGAFKGDIDEQGSTFQGDTGSAARFFYCAKASKQDRDAGLEYEADRVLAMSNQAKAELARGNMHVGESGMNTAKLRKNHHPTVKPTELMRWLCRLVTPKGGKIIDPFTGSGSTGRGAVLEGFEFVGIEREAEYVAIARERIREAIGPLFSP